VDLRSPVTRILVVGAAYALDGVVFGALAVGPPGAVRFWRLAAWVTSAAIFGAHVAYERLCAGRPPASGAARAAAAAAFGAFLLAAAGPARTRWGTDAFWRTAALALVLWPIVTGVPAFVVAWVGGLILSWQGRTADRQEGRNSRTKG